MKLRKIGAALAAVAVSGAIAYGVTVPLVTGPQDPGNMNATINGVVQSMQNNVSGLYGPVGGLPAATTGTTIQTLGTVNLPANLLATAGQGVRVRCWGAGTATGTNTMTAQFGTQTAFAVAGAGTTAGVFDITVDVIKTGASTQQLLSKGTFNVTLTTPVNTAGTQTDTAAIPIICSGTSTTSTNFTLDGMTVELLK
jgi:hypothetical protein